MERRRTRIIRLESDDKVPHWTNNQRIPANGNRSKCDIILVEVALVVSTPPQHLEVMPVQMERVFSGVVVVENDVDDVVLLEHVGVGVCSVNRRV